MTIKDLKTFIASMPDDMPVLVPSLENFHAQDIWAFPVLGSLLVTNVMRTDNVSYAVRKAGTIPALILLDTGELAYCNA